MSVVRHYHDTCKRIVSATWVYAPLQKQALIISSVPPSICPNEYMSVSSCHWDSKAGGLRKLKFDTRVLRGNCNLWRHFGINMFNVKFSKCLTGLAPSAQQLVNDKLYF